MSFLIESSSKEINIREYSEILEFSFIGFPENLNLCHSCAIRTMSAEFDKPFNFVVLTFKDSLNSSIWPILYPASYALFSSFILGRASEKHALDSASEVDMSSNFRRLIQMRTACKRDTQRWA